jgi:hypothetical protein
MRARYALQAGRFFFFNMSGPLTCSLCVVVFSGIPFPVLMFLGIFCGTLTCLVLGNSSLFLHYLSILFYFFFPEKARQER